MGLGVGTRSGDQRLGDRRHHTLLVLHHTSLNDTYLVCELPTISILASSSWISTRAARAVSATGERKKEGMVDESSLTELPELPVGEGER